MLFPKALSSSLILAFLMAESQEATVNLGRRDEPGIGELNAACGPQNLGLIAHDCNVAMYNFPYEGQNRILRGFTGTYLTEASGTCRVIISCPAGIEVSAGRLLTNNHQNGGYNKLMEQCSNQGLGGQIFVQGGCQIQTTYA